ncbi:hypothetical protein ACCS96_09840, partial [Rhizobium ruizarguesonis]
SDIAPAVASWPGQYSTSDFPKIGKVSMPDLSAWLGIGFVFEEPTHFSTAKRHDPHNECFVGTFSARRDLRPDWIGAPA